MDDDAQSMISIAVDSNELKDPMTHSPFDPKDNPPITLNCGHTLALQTINNLLASDHHKCPTCGTSFPKDQQFKKNSLISTMIQNNSNMNLCPIHKQRNVKFICITDKTLLCDLCLCEDLHAGHKKQPIAAVLNTLKTRKEENYKTIDMINSEVQKQIYYLEDKIKAILSQTENKLRSLVQNQLEHLVTRANQHKLKISESNYRIDQIQSEKLSLVELNFEDNESIYKDIKEVNSNFQDLVDDELQRVIVAVEPKLREIAYEKKFFECLDILETDINQLSLYNGKGISSSSSSAAYKLYKQKEGNENSQGKGTTPTPGGTVDPNQIKSIDQLKEQILKQKKEAEGYFQMLKQSWLISDDKFTNLSSESELLKQKVVQLQQENESLSMLLRDYYNEKK